MKILCHLLHWSHSDITLAMMANAIHSPLCVRSPDMVSKRGQNQACGECSHSPTESKEHSHSVDLLVTAGVSQPVMHRQQGFCLDLEIWKALQISGAQIIVLPLTG